MATMACATSGSSFLSDGTFTVDTDGVPRDVLQRATCAVLGTAFAQVVTVDQMIDKLT